MHVPRRGRNRRVPPGTRARRAAPLRHMQQHAMPRRKRKHSFHKRNGFRDASKKQIGGHGILRQALGNGTRRKQRSNFRGKGESVRRLRVIERLDTQRVARQEENRSRGIPLAEIKQRQSEHAPQFGQGILAPLFPCVNENFRIRLRCEAVAAKRQALSQVAIVVKLAVEDHRHVFGFVPDGLMAAGQVDDAQPAHPQCEPRRARISRKKALVIGTALAHRGGHGANARFCFPSPRSKRDAAYTAHAIV